MPEKMNVKEIKESVDVCLPNGQLNDEAIGFSRKPIQRPNLRSWGRNRRWDFWGIVSPQFFVGMSITSLNLVHACRVYLYDRERGRELSANAETIWSSGTIQPDSPPPIAIMAEIHKTLLRFVDRGLTTQLTAMAKHLDVALTVDSEGECLGAGPTRWATGSGRVDGRLTYWDDELEWSDSPSSRNAPWHIEGEKVDATLTPFHKRHSSHRVGIATSNRHQAFGTRSGQAFDENGTRHSLDGLTGWAERSKNPW